MKNQITDNEGYEGYEGSSLVSMHEKNEIDIINNKVSKTISCKNPSQPSYPSLSFIDETQLTDQHPAILVVVSTSPQLLIANLEKN